MPVRNSGIITFTISLYKLKDSLLLQKEKKKIVTIVQEKSLSEISFNNSQFMGALFGFHIQNSVGIYFINSNFSG